MISEPTFCNSYIFNIVNGRMGYNPHNDVPIFKMYKLINLDIHMNIHTYMRAIQKKSSHCGYNENGLHDINGTW